MTPRPSLAPDASPDAFAEAMVTCQGYAPACSDAFDCLQDGFCFSRDGRGFKTARAQIAALIGDQASNDVFTRAWLKLALDALDHHQFMARGALDAMKLVTINKRVRAEYGGSDL